MTPIRLLLRARTALVFLASLLSCSVFAQKKIELNANKTIESLRVSKTVPTGFLAKAAAGRTFQLNPQLQRINGISKGDTVTLSLFENKTFTSVVKLLKTDVLGTLAITANIPAYPMANVVITTAKSGKSLVSVLIPELNEEYTTVGSVLSETSYLLQLDPEKNKVVPCAGPMIPGEEIALLLPGEKTMKTERVQACVTPVFGANQSTNATIRLLVLYNADALTWSNSNQGGIANTIANGVTTAQTVWNNNALNATLELAHAEQVNYPETGNMSTDLNRLTAQTDGYLDHVHQLRRTHNADLVVLMTTQDPSSAGLGWLLNSTSGNAQTGFTVVLAQYFSSYTLAHEMGHNMGMNHDAANAGNNTPITPYAFGWRWTGSDSFQYRSVMAYTPGTRVGYFSDPTRTYLGVATGDASQADNARLFKEIKHVIADYKNKIAGTLDAPNNLQVLSYTDHGASVSWTGVTGAVNYRLYFQSSGSWYYYTLGGSSSSFVFNNATFFNPGTTYPWRVDAVNECGTVTASVQSSFTTTGILPVRLVSFYGFESEEKIHLNWNTVSEVNVSHFEIEKSSDSRSWTAAGLVQANGESSENISYNFVDRYPLPYETYYRLKMVDRDASFEYSKIIAVNSGSAPVRVYPNPAVSRVEIKGVDKSTLSSITLHTPAGMPVFSKLKPLESTIDVTSIPAGLYILQLKYETGATVTQKLLVTR